MKEMTKALKENESAMNIVRAYQGKGNRLSFVKLGTAKLLVDKNYNVFFDIGLNDVDFDLEFAKLGVGNVEELTDNFGEIVFIEDEQGFTVNENYNANGAEYGLETVCKNCGKHHMWSKEEHGRFNKSMQCECGEKANPEEKDFDEIKKENEMKKITRRHRIGTIEDILNIRCEAQGNGDFKVWRLKNNTYLFDGVYSKDELIEECNQ